MKRSILGATVGLLAIGIIPIPGHAQVAGPSVRSVSSLTCKPDIADTLEDPAEIQNDKLILAQAIAQHQPLEVINEAQRALNFDTADLAKDQQCQVTSEDE